MLWEELEQTDFDKLDIAFIIQTYDRFDLLETWCKLYKLLKPVNSPNSFLAISSSDLTSLQDLQEKYPEILIKHAPEYSGHYSGYLNLLEVGEKSLKEIRENACGEKRCAGMNQPQFIVFAQADTWLYSPVVFINLIKYMMCYGADFLTFWVPTDQMETDFFIVNNSKFGDETIFNGLLQEFNRRLTPQFTDKAVDMIYPETLVLQWLRQKGVVGRLPVFGNKYNRNASCRGHDPVHCIIHSHWSADESKFLPKIEEQRETIKKWVDKEYDKYVTIGKV